MKRALLVVGLMALMVLVTAACPKKKRPPQPPIPPPVETLPSMPYENPPPVENPQTITAPPTQNPVSAALRSVRFDFDKFDIRPGDGKIIEDNAGLMRGNSAKYTLEGYTDPVGTDEYNRGLGLRRSNSVKAYLVTLGLDAGRFSTISFGKEKLVTSDSLQFELNRRVEFVPQQ